jgi:hypothetical protein
MRVIIRTLRDGVAAATVVESDGPIGIDLQPSLMERHGPGKGNGFLGPDCLIQMESDLTQGLVVGLTIIPELGRDDSHYINELAPSDIPKV